MKHFHQVLLIVSTVLGSWLGMQAIHELGHVIGTAVSGGHVSGVFLHPFGLSRTEHSSNPRPLVVAWAGPVAGVMLPLVFWAGAIALRVPGAFVLRFFAGFCLIANGAYLTFGSFERVGDAGELLRHGSPAWSLWLFGAVACPVGLWLWHRQGQHFGLGDTGAQVSTGVTYATSLVLISLMTLGLLIGG
ncbi:zinc metalloprotease [Singulisphaera rosea]